MSLGPGRGAATEGPHSRGERAGRSRDLTAGRSRSSWPGAAGAHHRTQEGLTAGENVQDLTAGGAKGIDTDLASSPQLSSKQAPPKSPAERG